VKFYFMVVDREGFPMSDASGLGARISGAQDKDARLRAAMDAIIAERVG
jgi:hypothetical protein